MVKDSQTASSLNTIRQQLLELTKEIYIAETGDISNSIPIELMHEVQIMADSVRKYMTLSGFNSGSPPSKTQANSVYSWINLIDGQMSSSIKGMARFILTGDLNGSVNNLDIAIETEFDKNKHTLYIAGINAICNRAKRKQENAYYHNSLKVSYLQNTTSYQSESDGRFNQLTLNKFADTIAPIVAVVNTRIAKPKEYQSKREKEIKVLEFDSISKITSRIMQGVEFE